MDAVEVLRKRFDQRLMRRPLRTAPAFVDDDLRLGADTPIFAVGAVSPRGKSSAPDGSGPRLLALLRAGYGVPISPKVVDAVRRAATQWSRGDKALAHIHLALARLPRLAGREAAFRLFLADELLRAGVTPDALITALEADALDKFDPDQPRVPAGSGRDSGRWTSGGGGGVAPDTGPVVTSRSARVRPNAADQPFVVPIFFDEHAPYKDNPDEIAYQIRHQLGVADPEEEVAHGDAPSLAPLMVPVPRPGFAPGAAPPPRNVPQIDTTDDQPQLCPKPGPDHGGGRDPFALLYQQFVGTVVNPGFPPIDPRLGYALPNPSGGNPVMFDHCRFSNGNMIEAKGHYEGMLNGGTFMRARLAADFLEQADKQVIAAEALGRHVEWWFYEPETAEFARELFRLRGLNRNLSVFQQDYPGNERWPYPASATWARGRQRQ